MSFRKTVILVLCHILVLSFASLLAQVVTVVPTESTDAFRNPLKGFRYGLNSWDEYPYASVVRKYIKWNDLENDESDGIDKIIDYCNTQWAGLEQSNIKVIPRVYLNWNEDPGNEYWPADMTTGDYTSEQFKSRLRRLIQRLGQVWDNDPRIAWIQTGIIGKWGEQHSPQATADVQQLMGEEFTAAFPNKKLLTRRPWEYFTDWEWGGYWDAWATWGQINSQGEEIVKLNTEQERWKVTIWEGEVAYGCCSNEIQPGDSPDDTFMDPDHRAFFLNSISKFHCTALGWVSDYNTNDPVISAGAKEAQKAFGYRYVINEFSCSERTEPGSSLDVGFKVKNTGSAPFYEKWPVAIVLIDESTYQIVWKEELPEIDIRSWMPGSDFDWNPETDSGTKTYLTPAEEYEISATVTVPGGLASGQYLAGVSILEPYSRTPGIFFAIDNFVKESQTQPLCRIGIGEDLAGGHEVDPAIFDNLLTDDNRYYTLEWNGPTYNLSTSATTGGSISLGDGTYPENRNVFLKAEAELGYVFSGWSGDLSGIENPVIITMDSDISIIANFTAVPTYTLTTNAANGSIELDPAGGTYNENTIVTMTVNPDLGYLFSSWSGDISGSDNPETITMDANKNVTANFTSAAIYTLTTIAEGGTIALDPAGPQYTEGTVVKVTAIADPDYTFIGWSGDALNYDVWINPNFITMDADKNITAEFMADPNASNFINNGDFSAGLNNWNTNAIAPTNATFSIENGELKVNVLAIDDLDWHINVNQANVLLVSNETYTLTFDARAEFDKIITVNVQFDHAPWTSSIQQAVPITNSMETYQITWLQEQPAESYKVGFFFGSDTTNVWIDNVKLEAENATAIGNAVKANLAQNMLLMQNYPNPFNPETTIPYQLSKASHVKLEIYNLLGQRMATLVNEQQSAGFYSVKWSATDYNANQMASGIYLYRLETNESVQMKKFILIQ